MVIAFQLMNMSVDPVDHLVGKDDLAINEIESCVELIVEVLMGKVNAIEETDEADEGGDKRVGVFVMLFSINPKLIEFNTPGSVDNIDQNSCYLSKNYSVPLSIISPPPKS